MVAMMEALVILVLVAVAAFAAAMFVCYLAYAVPRVWARSWEGVNQELSAWEAKADASARRVRIEDQIKNRNRTRPSGSEVDPIFVQAAEMSKRISQSLALVKDATKTCCHIQKFTAHVRGVHSMMEIAWDPVCSNLREHVIDGIDVALESLRRYPIVDTKILKQHIGLGAIRERCEDCELLKYSVAKAPVLCSPAQSLGNRPGDEKD